MITIGIPFFNDDSFLDYAIKSVFNQTYTNWKLILVSDGGSDNSLSIAHRYEGDKRVRIIADGENRKLPYRLNQIAQLSTTKYLARMDADDIMHPKRLETQLEILEKNSEIDVLGTNVFSIDEANRIQGLRIKLNNDGYQLLKTKKFIHPTIMAKTEWFLKNPYNVDAIRMEDAELWSRTHKKNNFQVYTEPLLFYREFGSNYYIKYMTAAKSMFSLARAYNDKIWQIEGGKAMLKGGVYYIAGKLNLEHQLLAKRNYLVSEKLFKESSHILHIMNK